MASLAATQRTARLQTSPDGVAAVGNRWRGPGSSARVWWFALLLVALCFEGLGRKFVDNVPGVVFYFAKDVALIAGVVALRWTVRTRTYAVALYSPFLVVLGLAAAVTVAQMFNPSQPSWILALLGIRAYWLWWFAPFVIAEVFADRGARERAITFLGFLSIGLALYATLQFTSPPDADINRYALHEGEVRLATAIVGATGRARVASTFAFIDGYADYVALMAPLLAALGASLSTWSRRVVALTGAAALTATVAMTGSRQGIALVAIGLLTALFASGFHRARAGRLVLVTSTVAIIVLATVNADAWEGVVARWNGGDTRERILNALMVIPPVAIARIDFPTFGEGTGTQQNARIQIVGASTAWDQEEEPGRYLFELGLVGYLCVWAARFGLLIACIRMARQLRRWGCKGESAAAAACAVMTIFGRLTFDHVWQACYFIALGVVLGIYVDARRRVEATRPEPDQPSRRSTTLLHASSRS